MTDEGEKIPNDEEQQAAEEGRITEAQQRVNEAMEKQIKEMEQKQLDERLKKATGGK